MNAPDLSALAADFRALQEEERIKAERDARMQADCLRIAAKQSRHEAFTAGYRILALPALTSAEALFLSAALAQKLRASPQADYSDAFAAGLEVEMPNALWCLTDDEGGEE